MNSILAAGNTSKADDVGTAAQPVLNEVEGFWWCVSTSGISAFAQARIAASTGHLLEELAPDVCSVVEERRFSAAPNPITRGALAPVVVFAAAHYLRHHSVSTLPRQTGLQ